MVRVPAAFDRFGLVEIHVQTFLDRAGVIVPAQEKVMGQQGKTPAHGVGIGQL